MTIFNERSTGNFQGVDPRLYEILTMARNTSGVPFEISEGMRTRDRQQELFDSGASQTMNSRHLVGNAADIFIPDGNGGVNWDFEAYRPIAEAAKAAASQLGYNDFVWGGDWESLRDGVHFQVGGSQPHAGHQPHTPSQQAPNPRATVSTRGAPQMAQEQAPQGILGALGLQRREEGAAGPTGQSFYQRDNFKDLMGNLAMGFNSMTLNPDRDLARQVQAQQQGRRDANRRNSTIEWLLNQPGGEKFATMADAVGVGPALQAYQAEMAAANAPVDQTSAMQNYQFMLANGTDPTEAMERAFGGGTNIDIHTGDAADSADAALRTGLSESLVDEFSAFRTAGSASAAVMGDLNVLQELASVAPEGPVTGRFAEMFPEFSDVSALRTSIMRRVAPTLRVEGSGSTSDIEYQGMLDGFGNMKNTREANSAIISVMQAKSQFNMARADIVNRLMNDTTYSQAQATQDLRTLDQSSGIPEQVKDLLAAYGGGSTGTPAAGGGVPQADLDYLGVGN